MILSHRDACKVVLQMVRVHLSSKLSSHSSEECHAVKHAAMCHVTLICSQYEMSHCPTDCGGALCGWAAAPGGAGIPVVKGMLWRQLSPQGMIAVSRHLDYHSAAASFCSIFPKTLTAGRKSQSKYIPSTAPAQAPNCGSCAAGVLGTYKGNGVPVS